MRIKVMPMTVMIDPVTTEGKNRSSRLMNGAMTMPNMPAEITEPKITGRPRSGLFAIASIGDSEAKVTPIITGRPMPTGPTPKAWMKVAMPHANRSALISKATCSRGNLSAAPRISGTATAPAYITSTCWIDEDDQPQRRAGLRKTSAGWAILKRSLTGTVSRACFGNANVMP